MSIVVLDTNIPYSRLRHLEVNGYCLYGIPGENIRNVLETALFVSDVIGSVIPMLFAPVPSTRLFDLHADYYKRRGWCDRYGRVRDLHMLNGKLYPFLQVNEGSIDDYIELQRMMFMLNQNYRSKSFNVFGKGAVAGSFRQAVSEFGRRDCNSDVVGAQPPSELGQALISRCLHHRLTGVTGDLAGVLCARFEELGKLQEQNR